MADQQNLQNVTAYLTDQMAQLPEQNVEIADYTRVLFFIQDESHQESTPVTNYLASLINSNRPDIMKMYLQHIIDDTKKADHDPQYKQFMKDLYTAMNNLGKGVDEGELSSDENALQNLPAAFFTGIQLGFSKLGPREFKCLMVTLENIAEINVGMSAFIRPIQQTGIAAMKDGGKRLVTALVTIELSYAALKNIYLWWHGKISGKYCAKAIIDATIGIGCGVAGGAVGANVGGLFGPVGTVAGAAFGSIIMQCAGKAVIEKLTCKIFNVPQSAALDNAYRYLGVDQYTSNYDINKAYREKALLTHPDKADKGGSHEAFLDLQCHMGIIKVAKGEIY